MIRENYLLVNCSFGTFAPLHSVSPSLVRAALLRQGYGWAQRPSLHFVTFGPPGIGPGLHDPQPCVLPLYDGPSRGAGNRTRSTRTRIVRTTGILHPDIFALPTDKAGAPCRIRTYDLSNVNRML